MNNENKLINNATGIIPNIINAIPQTASNLYDSTVVPYYNYYKTVTNPIATTANYIQKALYNPIQTDPTQDPYYSAGNGTTPINTPVVTNGTKDVTSNLYANTTPQTLYTTGNVGTTGAGVNTSGSNLTAGQVTPSGLGLVGETELEKQARLAAETESAYLNSLGADETDQARRNRITDEFQSEIDNLDRIYSISRQEAAKAATANLGTDTAIQARRGLIGSSFGEARTSGVEAENAANLEKINVAQGNARAAIESKIRAAITQDKSDKIAAKKLSTSAYKEYRDSLVTKANDKSKEQIAYIVNSKYDATDDELTQWATALGVDANKFKSDYKVAKDSATASAEENKVKMEKAKAEVEKMIQETIKTGGDVMKVYESGGYNWQYNPSTGKVEPIGEARSTSNSITNTQYNSKNIPESIKSTLLVDVKEADNVDELMAAYPNVDTSYIQDLFDQLN